MKTYSIGRDTNCDIVINDKTDVVSRRHALINVFPSGKMTIVDQSSNGTYVNGIRVSPNVPVPVTRKDIISLAHIVRLDWNMVPKSNEWVKYVLIAFVSLILLNAAVMGVYYLFVGNKKCDDAPKVETVVPEMVVKDTTSNKAMPEVVKKEGSTEQDRPEKNDEKQVKSSAGKKEKKKNDDTKQEVKEKDKTEKETPSKQGEPKKPARVAG